MTIHFSPLFCWSNSHSHVVGVKEILPETHEHLLAIDGSEKSWIEPIKKDYVVFWNTTSGVDNSQFQTNRASLRVKRFDIGAINETHHTDLFDGWGGWGQVFLASPFLLFYGRYPQTKPWFSTECVHFRIPWSGYGKNMFTLYWYFNMFNTSAGKCCLFVVITGYFVVLTREIIPRLKLWRFCGFFKRHFDNEQPENSISRPLCMNFVVAVLALAHNKQREKERVKNPGMG